MSATAPTTFEKSLAEAEAEAFRVLCSALASEPGRSAFLGDEPPHAESWSFRFTSPVATDASYWSAHDFPVMAYGAVAVYAGRNRAAAQAWVMGIVKALPVFDSGNLRKLRISNVGPVVADAVQYPNETKPWQVWRATVEFDAEFLTGGKTRQEE